MNKPKVSIIVPVHNAGEYFEICLNSLINQTLKELEILLVIDCPTDGSDRTAEKFAEKEDRIKLIYNESNLHVGLSRNKGLEHATGEYVGFCDHDDYCDLTMFELLYNKIKSEELDIVRCNYLVEENGIITKPSSAICEPIENLSEYSYTKIFQQEMTGYIWNHLFELNFLKRNDIKFIDSRLIKAEDQLFFIEAYIHTNKIGFIPDFLYCHVIHENNTHLHDSEYTSLTSNISYLEYVDSFIKQNELEKHRLLYSQGAAKHLYSYVYNHHLKSFKPSSLKEIKKTMKLIKENEIIYSNLGYLLKAKNWKALSNLKMTTISFLLVMKLI